MTTKCLKQQIQLNKLAFHMIATYFQFLAQLFYSYKINQIKSPPTLGKKRILLYMIFI